MAGRLTYAITVLVCSGTAGMAAPACDPNQQQNDIAQQQSRSGNYGEAARIARGVVAQHPDDYRAHYELGYALLAQSTASKASDDFSAGMRELIAAEPLLQKQDPACAKAKSWYSLYATVGYYYYLHGDLANAEKWLGLARANFDKLGPEWQQRTLQYSAVLAFRKGDLNKAGQYSSQATRAGAPDAARLNRAVQTIQGAQ